MNTPVTIVNLIHDTATDKDTPVCWVFQHATWRETYGSSGNGTVKDPAKTVHVRIMARMGEPPYLPAYEWYALPAEAKEKAWTLKNGWMIVILSWRSPDGFRLRKLSPILMKIQEQNIQFQNHSQSFQNQLS